MPEKQLIQKIWGEKRVFTIKDDHIHFQKKTLKENVEYTVKFEEVSFQMVKKVERTANFVLYIYVILTLGAVYGLVNGFIEHAPLPELICWSLGIMFFGFFCLSLYRLRNWETIYISAGSKPLNLMATKPDRQTVLTFIDTIHNAVRNYFKSKYTNFDSDTPYEEIVSNLKWLKEINSITDNEIEELIAIHKARKIIGFKPDNY